MNVRIHLRTAALLACIFVSAADPSGTHAQQQDSVRGRVLGPDGQPLAGQHIVLHRVDDTSGVTVAEGVSSDDGSFTLVVTNAAGAPDGVYFLAGRYDGELYLGDAFRAPFDDQVQHVVQVGNPATSARNLVSMSGEGTTAPVDDPAQWLLYALPAAGVLVFALLYMFGRTRIPERRRLLAEIARIDERGAVHGADLAARRAELLSRLTQTTAS